MPMGKFGRPHVRNLATPDYLQVAEIYDMVEAFHQAFRSLRRQPAFSGSVVAIMALGIGACTAMFSIITAVFFDPLPYTEPERLAIIWHAQGAHQASSGCPQATTPPTATRPARSRPSRPWRSVATTWAAGSSPFA